MSQSHKVSLILQDLASNISDILQDTAGEPLAFVLVVSADNTAQYVSNAGRADGTELIESLLERWKAGRADIPAHYNPDLKSPAPVAVQPSQWQDIATAPKDGAAVRLWFPTVPYPCAWDGWWSATARRWVPHEPGRDVIVSDLPEPTHWQPLTSPLSSSPEDKPK